MTKAIEVRWNNEVRKCRTITPVARNVVRGDLITTKNGLAEVICVQGNCESINKFGKPFVAILAVLRDGTVVFDNSNGRKTVFRTVRTR